jgi:DNA processing protein
MFNILTLTLNQLPECLQQIPQPPPQLFCSGTPLAELLLQPVVAIVGTRTPTPYGRHVTLELSKRLAERGIVIISGLALGVDALAHQAALEVGGKTIAVLPSPLDYIVPATNRRLADRILEHGGTLVSEYRPGSQPYKQNFVARNRIVSGLAQAVVITEASSKSGTLHTSRFAHEQGREVLAVPGNITSQQSAGTNTILKTHAALITDYTDVLAALGLTETLPKKHIQGGNDYEQRLIDLIQAGTHDGSQLLATSSLSAADFNRTLTMLELKGIIRALGGHQWALR